MDGFEVLQKFGRVGPVSDRVVATAVMAVLAEPDEPATGGDGPAVVGLNPKVSQPNVVPPRGRPARGGVTGSDEDWATGPAPTRRPSRLRRRLQVVGAVLAVAAVVVAGVFLGSGLKHPQSVVVGNTSGGSTPAANPHAGVEVIHLQGPPVAVSCPTAGFCVAVDDSGNVLTFDGSRWSAPTLILPNGGFASVSCPTVAFCAALGRSDFIYLNGRWVRLGYSPPWLQSQSLSCVTERFCVAVGGQSASIWDGRSWSRPATVDRGSGPLQSVSCPTVTFCMAVDAAGRAVTLHGRSWTQSAVLYPGQGGLVAVSCPTVTFCVAVGGNGGTAVTYRDGRWQAPKTPDPDGDGLDAVSCPTATFCAALDRQGGSMTYDGIAWSARTKVVPGRHLVQALSCPTAASCVTFDIEGQAVTRTSRGWGAPLTVDPPGGDLAGVSCSTAGFCAAVDIEGNAVVYNGQRWSPPTLIDPEVQEQYGTPNLVTCAAGPFCVDVDWLGRAIVYNGQRWLAPTVVVPGNPYIVSVSCASASFCVALDSAGAATIYNGTSWSHPVLVGKATHPHAISCPTPTFCAAADVTGTTAFVYNGHTWHATTIDPPNPDYGPGPVISCATASFCLVAQLSTVHIYNGHTWRAAPPAPSGDPQSLSCPAVGVCETLLNLPNVEVLKIAAYLHGKWSPPTPVDPSGRPTSLSCPSVRDCILVDASGYALTTTIPAAP
jgi:hypothetical protein